jgi:uncharacterized protein (DUF1800 family)
MLSRRSFNTASLSFLLLSKLKSEAFANDIPASVRILNRLTFGSTPDQRVAFEKLGLKAWLDRELAKPVSDIALDQRLADAKLWIGYEDGSDGKNHKWKKRGEMLPYQYLKAKGASLVKLTNFETFGMDWEERVRPAREIQAAAWIRAIHGDAQLREVLTQFWHDHFNVNATRDEATAAFFPPYDTMLRSHALGNFREMLGGVARSPAMLSYLNNNESKASPANENFARELFELHTLGAMHYFNDKYTDWKSVPGALAGHPEGYIDQDVYEAARAFTGWTVGDGHWIAEGEDAPFTGEFLYTHGWHDPYQKRILGVEFLPNTGPMADGERVLDLAAYHPATAKFITLKICKRLLSDKPSEKLVRNLSEIFIAQAKSPDQIAQVVRALVLSQEFSETQPSKMKRPFEFVASLYRATGAEMSSPTMDLHYQLVNAGWMQHEWRPPTGHPDKTSHWANTNTLSRLTAFAFSALDESFNGSKFDALAVPTGALKSTGDLLRFWEERMMGTQLKAPQKQAIIDSVGENVSDDVNERQTAARTIIGLAALTPQFLLR